jgi:hypothetical protein
MFLRNVVCLSISFQDEKVGSFSSVPRAMHKTCVRRDYLFVPNPLDLVYMYEFLQKYLLDPKDLLLNDALAYLRRNPVCNIVLNLIQNLIESSLMGKI